MDDGGGALCGADDAPASLGTAVTPASFMACQRNRARRWRYRVSGGGVGSPVRAVPCIHKVLRQAVVLGDTPPPAASQRRKTISSASLSAHKRGRACSRVRQPRTSRLPPRGIQRTASDEDRVWRRGGAAWRRRAFPHAPASQKACVSPAPKWLSVRLDPVTAKPSSHRGEQPPAARCESLKMTAQRPQRTRQSSILAEHAYNGSVASHMAS